MSKELRNQINQLREMLTEIKLSGDVPKADIQKTQQKLDKLIEKMYKNDKKNK